VKPAKRVIAAGFYRGFRFAREELIER